MFPLYKMHLRCFLFIRCIFLARSVLVSVCRVTLTTIDAISSSNSFLIVLEYLFYTSLFSLAISRCAIFLVEPALGLLVTGACSFHCTEITRTLKCFEIFCLIFFHNLVSELKRVSFYSWRSDGQNVAQWLLTPLASHRNLSYLFLNNVETFRIT